MIFFERAKVHLVAVASPIPALTCPDTPELGLRRSRPAQPIAVLWVSADRERASPAFGRICPASECRITSLGMLMQNAG